jgi:hypothetical protein
MVSVHASSAVDRGFEPRLGQTKDYKIGICCFAAEHTALSRKSKDCWLGIRIMCPSGATCSFAGLKSISNTEPGLTLEGDSGEEVALWLLTSLCTSAKREVEVAL